MVFLKIKFIYIKLNKNWVWIEENVKESYYNFEILIGNLLIKISKIIKLSKMDSIVCTICM